MLVFCLVVDGFNHHILYNSDTRYLFSFNPRSEWWGLRWRLIQYSTNNNEKLNQGIGKFPTKITNDEFPLQFTRSSDTKTDLEMSRIPYQGLKWLSFDACIICMLFCKLFKFVWLCLYFHSDIYSFVSLRSNGLYMSNEHSWTSSILSSSLSFIIRLLMLSARRALIRLINIWICLNMTIFIVHWSLLMDLV